MNSTTFVEIGRANLRHCVFLLGALVASLGIAQGATITVDTTDGGGVNINGNCSLAEALVSSNFNVGIDACTAGTVGGDVIAFDSSIFSGSPFFSATISLQQSLDITDGGITLEPPTGRNLIIQTGGANRLFTISGGDSVIRRVTLNGGSTAGDGGAILINSPDENSSLQLEDAFLNNNSAAGSGGAIGGLVGEGIFNLNVFSSSFSSNASNGITGSDSKGGGAIGIVIVDDFGFLNVLIEDSLFLDNEATASHGGAISLFPSALDDASFGLTLTNSIFSSNSSAESGGAIFLASESSSNGYSATIRNNSFSMNSADRAGAIFAGYVAVNVPSDLLLLERNSFVANTSTNGAGAVDIRFIDTLIRNNLFALNQSESPNINDPGALHLDHDGFINDTVSDGGADIRANTFFENSGAPNDIQLEMPLISEGADGPSRFDGNIVHGLIDARDSCVITNSPRGNFNASNIADGCAPGARSISGVDLGLMLQNVAHPVHSQAAIPLQDSPVVDFWPEIECTEKLGGAPLESDLVGERRDSITGLPPDGDGDMSADCDAGSIEMAQAFSLDVSVSGTGSGSVVSDVNGIDCPGDCSEAFAEGSMVELFASADAGSSFVGWSGDCSGTGSCIVTMDQARSVTATFEPAGQTLTILLDGNGTGQVSSSPAGVDCPGTCSFTFASGTVVDLVASADPGAEFLNWAGDCTGTTCQVTLDEARSVIAIFGDGDLLFLDGFE